MAEIKEFVVNDRRKFTSEGDIRPDAPPSEPKPERPEAHSRTAPPEDAFGSSARLIDRNAPPAAHAPTPAQPTPTEPSPAAEATEADQAAPAPPTADESSQAHRAYSATVGRLDTALHAANPGIEPIPAMTFDRLIQSLYMQALFQLGGMAEKGQQPQLDLLGARQTIDMLAVLEDKTHNNLADSESRLLKTALFELRMGFLEVTQALARQAQQAPPNPNQPAGAPSTGPRIVR